VQVVLAGRDVGEQVPPLATHDLLGLGLGDQVCEHLAGRHVGERTARRLSTLPLAVVRRFGELGELVPLAAPDDEEPRPSLRHAVVRSVQHPVVVLVAGGLDLPEKSFEGRAARLVVEGQGIHVLEDELPGLRLGQHPHVGLEEAGSRIDAVALPVEPEP
jgi:hypothetical protein